MLGRRMKDNLLIFRKSLAAFILILNHSLLLSGQVKVRLFTDLHPESVVFSAVYGEYLLETYNSEPESLKSGEPVLISKINKRLMVKPADEKGFFCDSVRIYLKDGKGSFSLRTNGTDPVKQVYSGDIKCLPDLATLLIINICDIESYIAGVVRSEGGPGKNIEYFKTQAILARTYLYKNFGKHLQDGYNLCDGTHCQAFNGATDDSVIIRAAFETAGLVILGPDSMPIIAVFHSNCGGETSPSDYVWLSEQSYLKNVSDPYCSTSRNARWQIKVSIQDWLDYLKSMGYNGDLSDESLLNFSQKTRLNNFRAGTFSLPLRQIRADLHLRSAFFSLSANEDSVIFNGKGYGHGVGLCQEGAMNMASKGFNYKQIIDFYFTGVIISDIKNALVEK
jgi:stage II sporulation protein D